MNAQSRGKVHLKSSDQAAPPRILLNYLQHPFDLQVMIQGVRKAMGFAQSAGFAHGSFDGLKSDSDDDIMVSDPCPFFLSRNYKVALVLTGSCLV